MKSCSLQHPAFFWGSAMICFPVWVIFRTRRRSFGSNHPGHSKTFHRHRNSSLFSALHWNTFLRGANVLPVFFLDIPNKRLNQTWPLRPARLRIWKPCSAVMMMMMIMTTTIMLLLRRNYPPVLGPYRFLQAWSQLLPVYISTERQRGPGWTSWASSVRLLIEQRNAMMINSRAALRSSRMLWTGSLRSAQTSLKCCVLCSRTRCVQAVPRLCSWDRLQQPSHPENDETGWTSDQEVSEKSKVFSAFLQFRFCEATNVETVK